MTIKQWQLSCCALLAALLISASLPLEGARLHSILVAATEDWSIGDSVVCDLEEMEVCVSQIASECDLELVSKVFSGRDFKAKKVAEYVKSLDIDAEDVVIYYQSSHGFRTQEMSEQWPALYFGWGSSALRLQDVSDVIKEKEPAFSLVMADVCNSMINGAPSFQEMNTRQIFDASAASEAYWKLFRETKGHVTACSSKPGQYSYCMPGTGGVFTVAFLKALDQAAQQPNPSWKGLMQATNTTSTRLARRLGIQQKPVYCLEGECEALLR